MRRSRVRSSSGAWGPTQADWRTSVRLSVARPEAAATTGATGPGSGVGACAAGAAQRGTAATAATLVPSEPRRRGAGHGGAPEAGGPPGGRAPLSPDAAPPDATPPDAAPTRLRGCGHRRVREPCSPRSGPPRRRSLMAAPVTATAQRHGAVPTGAVLQAEPGGERATASAGPPVPRGRPRCAPSGRGRSRLRSR